MHTNNGITTDRKNIEHKLELVRTIDTPIDRRTHSMMFYFVCLSSIENGTTIGRKRSIIFFKLNDVRAIHSYRNRPAQTHSRQYHSMFGHVRTLHILGPTEAVFSAAAIVYVVNIRGMWPMAMVNIGKRKNTRNQRVTMRSAACPTQAATIFVVTLKHSRKFLHI
jgi:hypothetical protein